MAADKKGIICPCMITSIGLFSFCHSFSITLFCIPWMISLNGHIMVIGRLGWSLHMRVTCYILYFESPTHLLGQISSPIVDSITSRNDSVYTLISPSFLGSIWIYQRPLKWFLGRLQSSFLLESHKPAWLELTWLPKWTTEVRFASFFSADLLLP